MTVKSRDDINTTITTALVSGGRQTTAAAVRSLLTDMLDSLSVYGDMHVVDGAVAQVVTTTFAAVTKLTTTGQSLGMTLTPAQGKIVPAVAGTYAVRVKLRCTGEAGYAYTIRLLVNGSPVATLKDTYEPADTAPFLLILDGYIQTSAASQEVILQAASDDAGGADLTIVQGSFVMQRVQ